MKKIFTLFLACASVLMVSAQLPYDTEMTKNDFNNAQTVYEVENASWALTGGVTVGKTIIFGDAIESYFIIALPQDGVPEKLSFTYTPLSGGTASIYESTDHKNWNGMWTMEISAGLGNIAKPDSVSLKPSTRYLKFAYKGKGTMIYSKIRVRELKKLECSTPAFSFSEAYVDAPEQTQTAYITWSNIVASVSSTNPAFTASLATVGEKNKLDQSTALKITYSHAEAGEHKGAIIISGEGREVRIAVDGKTNKYEQSINWAQTLDSMLTVDQLTLTATATSGLDIVYESSDPSIATVSEQGELIITRSGEITLTATQPGNYKYMAAEPVSKTLRINKTTPDIALTCANIVYGQTLAEAALSETIGAVPGTLTWLDQATDTVLNAGSYIFRVLFTPENENWYNSVTMPVALVVEKAPQTIVWDIDELTTMQVGETLTVDAAATSGLNLTYAFTDCILTIENGHLTAEQAGSVLVIAFQEGNENYLPTTVLIKRFEIEGGISTATQSPVASDSANDPANASSAGTSAAAQKLLRDAQLYIVTPHATYTPLGAKLSK